MNLFDAIAGFFGRKKKEEDRPKVQVTVKQPTPLKLVDPSRPATPRAPGSLIPMQQENELAQPTAPVLNLGGVKPSATPLKMAATPATPKPAVKQPQRKNIIETTADAFNDTVDTLKAGFFGDGGIGDSAKKFNEGVGQGVKDIRQAIPRAVKSFGLDARGDQTYAPQNEAEKYIYGEKPIRNSEGVGSDALGIVGLNQNSLANRIVGSLLNAADVVPVGVAGKKAINTTTDIAREVRPLVDIRIPSREGIPETPVRQPELRMPDDLDIPSPAREPMSPITSSPTTNKPDAITSANPNYRPPTVQPQPTVQQPSLVIPQVAEDIVPPIQMRVPELRAPVDVPAPRLTDEVVADAQQAIDEAAVNPVPLQPAPSQVLDIDSPKATETRAIAEASVPTAPVSEAELARAAANQAPTEAIANRSVDDLVSYEGAPDEAQVGDYMRRIANGETVEPLIVMRDSSGKLGIEDGKHRYEAYKRLGYREVPTIERGGNTPDELGMITRRAAAEGRLTSDAEAEALGNRVGNAIEAEAAKLGTTWEAINKKVQAAWSSGVKDARETDLTPEEFEVARKAADELSLLRSRIDPSLLKEGQVGQFYSPRQMEDTKFTQELVNELSRDRKNGLRDNELDLSTTPYRQAIRRYSNAPEAMADTLIDSLETKVVKDVLGNETITPTGVKVPDEVKAQFKEDLKPFIKAQDDAIRAADSGDAKGIDAAVSAGDKAIDDALNKMAAKLPKNSVEARDAIGSMIAERKAYMQSTIRTNMFTNIVNRMFDQAQKAIVNFGDQALPLVNKISSKMTSETQPGIATDRISNRLARKFSKGTLINQQNRNFKTNVRLAGANARNPVTKVLSKADAAYRSAGTYLTSLGDLSTNAVKATNLVILGKGRAEGLKTAPELEAYLVKNLQTPEYMDIYRNMSNQYSGYIGMPQTLTSTGVKGSKASEFFSKIDNAVKNTLDKSPLPDRVKQELNDLVMPAITGFAGATSRVAAKQLNALALGIPNIVRGKKLAASDSPNARAIGEMMISRSIIDGVMAGGVMTGGALLGATGHWTGSYPDDPNERARWEKEGITPDAFAFDVGDKTVYIQPGRILGALALPMVLPAVIAQSIKDGTSPEDAVSSVLSGTIGQFNENLGADAIISHIGDLNKLINGNESDKTAAQKSLMNMLGYSMSNVVPASGALNNAAAASDPYKRDTSGGVVDIIANRNPVTRQGLPIKQDNLGNDLPNRSQLTLGSAALTVGDSQRSDQPAQTADGSANLDAEINRLAKAKHEVMPARDVKNSNSQNDAKTLMRSKLYQSADDETKAAYLKDTLLGTKTKDISKNLNETERSALIEYKLQNEDQRKKWLEDNDNSSNYYTADYNNLKARNLLTSDDENLENKSGAKYKMIRSQVDKEFGADAVLKQLYSDTSETEWRAMTDPESEGYDPDTAGKLLAYDDARTKAGVSGKSSTSKKNKYVLKTGKGSGSGGGGRGGSGSDKFAFASIPSSLVGGSTSKAYDENAPTFKPIADLKAPAPKDIPKGRTISVKKGIQI